MSTGLFSDSMRRWLPKPPADGFARGSWWLLKDLRAHVLLLPTAFVKCVKIQVVPCFVKYTFALMRECLLDTLKLNLSGL